MTCLYVEPDPTLSYPLKAFLICNMMPRQTGDWQAEADRTGTPDTMEISIEFTGMQEINTGVDNLALMILQSINKTGLFSADRRAFIGDTHRPYSEEGGSVDPRVFSAASNLPRPDGASGLVGYRAQAEDIATTESAAAMSNGQALMTRPASEHGPGPQ